MARTLEEEDVRSIYRDILILLGAIIALGCGALAIFAIDNVYQSETKVDDGLIGIATVLAIFVIEVTVLTTLGVLLSNPITFSRIILQIIVSLFWGNWIVSWIFLGVSFNQYAPKLPGTWEGASNFLWIIVTVLVGMVIAPPLLEITAKKVRKSGR